MRPRLESDVFARPLNFTSKLRTYPFGPFAHMQAFLDQTHGQITIGEIPPIRRAVLAAVGKIVGEILHNFGTTRQVDTVVGVGYDTDTNSAVAAIGKVLQANSRMLHDLPPAVQSAGDVQLPSTQPRPWPRPTDRTARWEVALAANHNL